MARPSQLKKPKTDVEVKRENTAQEMNRRIARAENDFWRHSSRIESCYKHAMPWRHKLYQNQPADQLDELFDENAMTIVEDFAADMGNTFTPQKNNWISIAPAVKLDLSDELQKRDFQAQLKQYQTVLFAEMERSNLYQALQECYLDLAPGTMAMIIQDIDISQPIHCQAIPAGTELLIDRGPYGFVDGKFRRWKCRGGEIPVYWPKAEKLNGAEWNDQTDYDVVDGVWRDWSDKGNEINKYAVMVNGKIVYEETYKGEGSCPILVARWSRDSTTAWGIGPLYRTTPAVKSLNHIKYLLLKKLDYNVDPVTSYENDGVMQVEEEQVQPGKWMARDVGSKAPEVVESKSKFDAAWLQADDLVSSIRRAHYQDRPDQLGKTPPSATQWADEAAERARRMGTPATNLVHEWQIPIVKRFAYLLHKRGVLPKVQLNGQDVALVPVSPLLRAQEQEEVVRYSKQAELFGQAFGPQIAAVLIDIFKHADKIGKALGTDDVLRKKEEIESAIKQLLPVLQTVNGAGGPATPPPVGLVAGGQPGAA